MPAPMYGVDPSGRSVPISVDERGRWMPSPLFYRTKAGLWGRALDWMGDNLPLTVLLFGINVQLGILIYLVVKVWPLVH